ncbi:MAG: DUF4199 family protein [Ignavibacteriae bacterium]|nr:DUF4199 family protein [Ignavibacteriota bacterium]
MLEKPSKFRSAAIAGAAMGVVSALPGLSLINCCCCAGIIGGGVLAFYLYKQEHREGMPALEATDGLVLGILAGLVGAFTATVLSLFILLVFGPWEAELMRTVMERVLESMEEGGSLPPGMSDQIRDEMEKSIAESSTALGILGGLIMNLIIYPIFGLLGGLLGYAFFKPKQVAPAAPSAPKL